MKYQIYTDGACDHVKNKIASAYLIRTKDFFVSQGGNSFDCSSVAVAESLAVGLAVEYMLKNCTLTREYDSVVIRTDSESVIEFFKDFKEPNSRPRTSDERVRATWNSLKRLNELCDVEFVKVVAHRDENNGNKVADRLAKYVLKICCEK